jgi:hypothetical protein
VVRNSYGIISTVGEEGSGRENRWGRTAGKIILRDEIDLGEEINPGGRRRTRRDWEGRIIGD